MGDKIIGILGLMVGVTGVVICLTHPGSSVGGYAGACLGIGIGFLIAPCS